MLKTCGWIETADSDDVVSGFGHKRADLPCHNRAFHKLLKTRQKQKKKNRGKRNETNLGKLGE